MVKVHRATVEAVGGPAVLLDSPFGFQENADVIAARAVEYFGTSVGLDVEVATLRRTDAATALEIETMLARVREANFVFAGPGSPSYALRQWQAVGLGELLAEKLRTGGAVTFASAAALTLGAYTLPVYEVYKVGEDPLWLDGLDVFGELGLRAALIPHFNNAEGGNHDTRFCYMGERRLRLLEEQLPEDVPILGVDEHTALVVDVDRAEASVEGLGTVTIRHRGRAEVLPSGATVPIAHLAKPDASPATPAAVETLDRDLPPPPADPLEDQLTRLGRRFDEAIAGGDSPGAVAAALDLEQLITDWSADTLQSDVLDRARATLRSMVVRLGEAAVAGLEDPRARIGGFVDALLAERNAARSDQDWARADRLRDALLALGIEIHDTPDDTTWDVRGD